MLKRYVQGSCELHYNLVEKIGAIRPSTYLIFATGYPRGASNHQLDELATQAMSFAEVKKLLGVEEFRKLRERL